MSAPPASPIVRIALLPISAAMAPKPGRPNPRRLDKRAAAGRDRRRNSESLQGADARCVRQNLLPRGRPDERDKVANRLRDLATPEFGLMGPAGECNRRPEIS